MGQGRRQTVFVFIIMLLQTIVTPSFRDFLYIKMDLIFQKSNGGC